MTLSRRTLVAGMAALPAITLMPDSLAAAGFPGRPIHLIVPFAAWRQRRHRRPHRRRSIGKGLNQTVVVENRAGAGGGIGAEYVARAAPDGYTLLVGSNGPLTVNPFLHANLGYDPLTDFVAVALTSYVPHALIVSSKLESRTLQDVLARGKKTPVTVATSGVGSATHMTLERLKAATGANFVHVPYRGGGALLPDLIGGSVNAALTELSTALPLHTSGKAHIVAIASAHRSALAPDVQTFEEGGVKGFTAQSYIGIVVPAKTPPDIVEKLQNAVSKGLAPGSAAAQRLVALGSEIATPEQMTSKGFAAFIRADYLAMEQAAKLAGIKPD